MTQDLLEHIYKAREEAIKRKIKKLEIIIDEDVAVINGCYVPIDERTVYDIPLMIMGMKVKYIKNLAKDYDYNFIIREEKITNPLLKYSTEELLQELLRREQDSMESEEDC